MMRAEFPGVTDEEIQWLSTMTEAAGQPVSPAGRTPRGSSKPAKARTTQAGLTTVRIRTSVGERTHGPKRTERDHAAPRRRGGRLDTALNPSKQLERTTNST